MPPSTESSSPAAGRRVAWVLGTALAIAWLVATAVSFWPYGVDDAFITFRYARHLLDGHGPVFEPGSRVEGYSNPTWVLLSAAWIGFGWPVLTASKIAGLASAVALVLGVAALGRELARGAEHRGLRVGVPLALVGTCAPIGLWAVAGLETVFVAALLVWSAASVVRDVRRGRLGGTTGLLLVVLWASRPEAPGYVVGLVAYGLWALPAGIRAAAGPRRYAVGTPGAGEDGDAPDGGREAGTLRRARPGLLVLAAGVVSFELFGLLFHGHLLPATHAAKVEGREWRFVDALLDGRGLETLPGQVLTDLGWAWTVLLALGVVGNVLGARRTPGVLNVLLLGGLVFLAYAFDDWMPALRLAVPVLPLLFLWVGWGVGELARRLGARVDARIVGAVAAVLCLAFAGEQATRSLAGESSPEGSPLDRAADWPLHLGAALEGCELVQAPNLWALVEHVPEGEGVALGAIGLPGYALDGPVFDLRGLVTESAARARHDDDPEALRAMADELLERRPAVLLFPASLERRLAADPADGDPEGSGGPLVRLVRELATRPAFTEGYGRAPRARYPRSLAFERLDLGPVDVAARRARVLERVPELRAAMPTGGDGAR